MSGDVTGYYIVIKTFKSETNSRFSRLRQFLSSHLANLLYRLRKRASKIIINGKPIIPEPDLPPLQVRKLSFKQMKKLKKVLQELDIEKDQDKRRFYRPGIFAPCSTPETDDIDIEVIRTDSEVIRNDSEIFDVDDILNDEADCRSLGDDTDSDVFNTENERRKLKRARPKAAKGKRGDVVIPPYVIIDEDLVPSKTGCKKKRPMAAKGRRRREDMELIDLPADLLLEELKEMDKEPHYSVKARCRPQAARGPRQVHLEDLPIDLQVEELLRIYELEDENQDVESPMGKRPQAARRTGQAAAREAVSGEIPADLLDEKVKVDEEEDDESDDDIFNVPYLPKSQRKYAAG